MQQTADNSNFNDKEKTSNKWGRWVFFLIIVPSLFVFCLFIALVIVSYNITTSPRGAPNHLEAIAVMGFGAILYGLIGYYFICFIYIVINFVRGKYEPHGKIVLVILLFIFLLPILLLDNFLSEDNGSSSVVSRHSVEPSARDIRVCGKATWAGKWQMHPEFELWVEEAQSRNLTPEECERLRGRRYAVPPSARDIRVCSLATWAGEWQKHPEFELWVEEAQSRELTLADCKKLLNAN